MEEYKGLDDVQKTALWGMAFCLLICFIVGCLVGGWLGFVWGSGTQEQIMLDQMAIRDLSLDMCYSPQSGETMDALGKGSLYIAINMSDPLSVKNYEQATGKKLKDELR